MFVDQIKIIKSSIPKKSIPLVSNYLKKRNVNIKVSSKRYTKHGDFRILPDETRQISINKTLNKINIEWFDDKSICIVMCSKGYPDKFEKEFLEFSGLSYKRLMDEPWQNPVLAANGEFARRRDIAQNMDDVEIARTLRWTTKKTYHKNI